MSGVSRRKRSRRARLEITKGKRPNRFWRQKSTTRKAGEGDKEQREREATDRARPVFDKSVSNNTRRPEEAWLEREVQTAKGQLLLSASSRSRARLFSRLLLFLPLPPPLCVSPRRYESSIYGAISAGSMPTTNELYSGSQINSTGKAGSSRLFGGGGEVSKGLSRGYKSAPRPRVFECYYRTLTSRPWTI